jgi:hypothetical protein
MPFVSMSFGSPGIPVPKGFDPAVFVTDSEKLNIYRKQVEATLHEARSATNILKKVDTAVPDSAEIPPWPFKANDIPAIR